MNQSIDKRYIGIDVSKKALDICLDGKNIIAYRQCGATHMFNHANNKLG